MSPAEARDAMKRASIVTQAKLTLKRAERHGKLFPAVTVHRDMIRDLRLALGDAIAELERL